jgi:parallel beta-helix repeat protein
MGNTVSKMVAGGLCSVFENCVIQNASLDASATALLIEQPAVVVCNSDLSHTGVSGSTTVIEINSVDTTIYGCRITGKNRGICFTGSGSRGVIIGNNVIYSCGGFGVDLAELIGTSYHVRFCGNTIYNCVGGILVNNAALIRPNVFIDNHITDCGGFAFDSAYKAVAEVPGVFIFNRTRGNTSGAIDGHGDWEDTLFNHVIINEGGAETDYVDAAGGDFTLLSSAAGISKSAMPHRDIGAIQHGSYPTYLVI